MASDLRRLEAVLKHFRRRFGQGSLEWAGWFELTTSSDSNTGLMDLTIRAFNLKDLIDSAETVLAGGRDDREAAQHVKNKSANISTGSQSQKLVHEFISIFCSILSEYGSIEDDYTHPAEAALKVALQIDEKLTAERLNACLRDSTWKSIASDIVLAVARVPEEYRHDWGTDIAIYALRRPPDMEAMHHAGLSLIESWSDIYPERCMTLLQEYIPSNISEIKELSFDDDTYRGYLSNIGYAEEILKKLKARISNASEKGSVE